MKLLFTDASGFLGRSVYQLLEKMHVTKTVGLTPQDDHKIDIVRNTPIFTEVLDIVSHVIGKAHSTLKTEEEKQALFDINLQDAKNLCTALGQSSIPKAFIFISTVAVYSCDSDENIMEEHPLNETTLYVLSKIKTEKYLEGWCTMHNAKLSILWPSLIAGPNPPGNLGAMIHRIKANKYLSITKGGVWKSVLMVQDVANLFPTLIERGGIYNTCDSYQPSFRELEIVMCKQLNRKIPISILYWLAKDMAVIGDRLGTKAPVGSLKLYKIICFLTFSNEEAVRGPGWEPMNALENFRIE